jgi:hypothetical protein
LCVYFDNQAGLPARLSKILAIVSIALTPLSDANLTMIVLAIAFPASELLLSHQSIITSTQIIPPRQQCQLLPTERRIFMISSTAKSGSSASNKTFREFLLKKQPPPPTKTESTTNSLLMNQWSNVVLPMNASLNVTTIMMAKARLMTHFPIAMQVSCWQGMIQCHLRMMMIKMILFLMTCLD